MGRRARQRQVPGRVRHHVAQKGLWREAIYRWEKAVELDPTYAAAFNDLAIAYEHEGQLDNARKAYEKALELDPNNAQIRQNYELFKEINDRTNQGQEQVVGWRSPRLPPRRRPRDRVRRRLLRDPDRDADPGEARRVRRSSACSSPASSPAATEDVDANQETVRLLRSQLRTKSSLKVIDADVLPLTDVAQEQTKEATTDEHGPPTRGAAGTPPPRGEQPMPLPQQIKEEKDLEPYERLFANVAYWKKIGEEYQNPLIVTGTVLFTPHSRSGFVQREQEIYDAFGRRRSSPCGPTWSARASSCGRSSSSSTAAPARRSTRRRYREEVLYNAQQNTPALSSYFELMDRIVPNFLSTLSSQKIRGTRVLLK